MIGVSIFKTLIPAAEHKALCGRSLTPATEVVSRYFRKRHPGEMLALKKHRIGRQHSFRKTTSYGEYRRRAAPKSVSSK
jgi:hypothetical protein